MRNILSNTTILITHLLLSPVYGAKIECPTPIIPIGLKISREIQHVYVPYEEVSEVPDETIEEIVDRVLSIIKKVPSFKKPYSLPIDSYYVVGIVNYYLESSFDMRLTKGQEKSLVDILSFYEDTKRKIEASNYDSVQKEQEEVQEYFM